MLDRLRNAFRMILDNGATLKRIETLLIEHRSSPIDRYLAIEASHRSDALFDLSYRTWNTARITKLCTILGLDGIKGKRILELGSGHSEIGAFLAELGAEVVCADGRAANINFSRLRHRGIDGMAFVELDAEQDFAHLGAFDIIINFGLLMHINDVDAHLRRCFRAAKVVVLESVVCDSTDPSRVTHFQEETIWGGNSIHGSGSRPSPFFIERVADECGFLITRCFTRDLNSGPFIYDWQHKNNGADMLDGRWWLRRFWVFERKVEIAG